MSGSGVAAKVKAEAEAGEMDRTQPARITLCQETRAAHTTNAESAELRVLEVKRALKGVQLQTSTPQADERQARLGENQSADVVHGRKMFEAVVPGVSSRGQETQVGIGFSGLLGEQEGSGGQKARYRREYRRDWREMFLG